MEIKSLSKTGIETIYDSFSRAFADYEVQINKIQLQKMLKRRGFDPDLSFAAFDDNRMVAFTFNGIGDFNGIPTAYDTGTGTVKDYQGRGLATKIFNYSIPFLGEQNIKQYLLEVLQHNTKAVSVYRKLGFEVSREFNYFIQKKEEIDREVKITDSCFSVRQMSIEKLHSVSHFWDFYPSWQNSLESVKRVPEDFIILGAFIEDKLTGYCVFEPDSGDITQIAVDKQNRRKGIGSLLLQEIIKLNKSDIIKVLNTDIACNSITDFLRAKNIHISGKQFEMIKEI